MEQTSQTSPISILYVEDDHEARDILLSMLALRFPAQRFYPAGNGLEGLDRFGKLQPAIVITDISMPSMDGITMSSRIKDIAPATIIIALTAHSETAYLLDAIAIGINHYLLKPLNYERLCQVIDQAVTTVNKEQQIQEQYEQISTLNAALTSRTRELESLNCELEAFNYTVAHDLRSPMVSIGGFSQYLLEKLAGSIDESSSNCLQLIYKETIRMNSLIEALLNFSGYTRKSIEKQWTDFSCIANEIRCNLLLREPERKVTFDIADGVNGFADPLLIGVVLENLFGNAWKYTAKNDAARIEFGVTGPAEELVYYVKDNGTGFDQAAAAELFVPFQRLHNGKEFAGFGIGLATVSRIIQRHDGRIWADGEKGRGATFYFSI